MYDSNLVIDAISEYLKCKRTLIYNVLIFILFIIIFLITNKSNSTLILQCISGISFIFIVLYPMFILPFLTVVMLESKNNINTVKSRNIYFNSISPQPKHTNMKSDQKFITIDIPSGYEIDKTNSTFEKIVFKPIKPVLPKRWEDLEKIDGYYVTQLSVINNVTNVTKPSTGIKNTWPTRELAEASIALAQLCQLRDVYNDGWIPNWKESQCCICEVYGEIQRHDLIVKQTMVFKSKKLRDEFFTNFKDLLKIAKPLL